ncbi:MAG TPA: hypothetical protein VKJ45_03790 [Blastocatellia bacterium]|nr:hypothetical protein [Blastocatellia bacterium]
MKKKLRLRFLAVCFLAVITIFAAFSTAALADQGGVQPSPPAAPPPPPPSLPPDFPWWIFLIFV